MSIRMHSFRNSVALLALGAVALAATPAVADKADLKSMSFDAQSVNTTIHVTSSDKMKWDTIKAGNAQFWGHMQIDTKYPGFVWDVAVVLGSCDDSGCNALPRIWSDQVIKRDYQNQTNFTFSTSKLPVSGTGITLGDPIIARCNQHLQADGPTKSYSFSHQVPATFIADTDETWGDVDNIPSEVQNGAWPYPVGEVDHARTDNFTIQVICDPVIKSPTADLKNDFGEFDVDSVKLFLTTYQNSQPGSNPGTVCPSLKVTSRAKANQAGPVTMRIWRQKDGGPITSDVQQAWASFDAAKNGYFATYEKWENVGTTAYFQYKTEIVDASPFAPSDGWKDITVHCTSPAGGGFTDQPRPDNDLPTPHAEWQGELTIADSAAADKSCPRKGQVFFAVTRAEPGDFDYRISCSNGAFFTGTATAYDQGSGIFEAYGAHDISVNRTRSIACTLQELQPAPVTVATDKENFTCNNPAIDPDADDVTTEPRPRPTKPTRPLVIVDPAPKCRVDETLVRGRCVDKPVVAVCRANEKLAGGRCIGVSIHCLPGLHQVGLKCVKNEKPDVSIFCKPGFVLKGKACVRKPEVSILCKPGFVLKGKTCMRKPEVSILCAKGFKLEGKTCVRKPVVTAGCSAGEKLVRNHCVPSKPDIAKVKRLAAPKPGLNKKVERALKLPLRRKLGLGH